MTREVRIWREPEVVASKDSATYAPSYPLPFELGFNVEPGAGLSQ